ncbi:hypothetical protein ABT346_26195, partial [Micromonospora peucetia]|uniref:hypothetical protein n=1 Tax=Micromonospora peucetia TaxID=47871 RepID=UPI003330730E
MLHGVGFLGGVWLFFENSTGCLISQCQNDLYPGIGQASVWLVLDSFGNILFVVGTVFQQVFVG